MNKKMIVLIVGVLVICLIGVILLLNSKSNNNESLNNNSEENNIVNNKDKKVAVIYFSASETTKGIAEIINKKISSDLIEIVPKEKYSNTDLNWNDSNSRTSIECNDATSRPEIANTINVDLYDVIFLGYPIWWGDVPHIILTFMDTYKLDGKTVIPFCTSGGTGISGSMNTLKKYNKNVNWLDGKRLSNESDVDSLLNSLNY